MAKISGLGDYFAVDDSGGTLRDISTDIRSLDVNIAQNLLDITGIDKSAMERLIGLADGTITVTGIFDASTANKAHDVFKTRTGTRTVDYKIGGNTSGNPYLTMEMLVTSYVPVHNADGSLTFTAGLSLQSGTTPTWSTVP